MAVTQTSAPMIPTPEGGGGITGTTGDSRQKTTETSVMLMPGVDMSRETSIRERAAAKP
jgi:hypothetical protein